MSQSSDTQLHNAIEKLNNKQKKALLGIVKVMTEEEKKYDHWEDKEFVAEMDRRYNEYKSGKTKLVSLDDVEKNARISFQKSRSKKVS